MEILDYFLKLDLASVIIITGTILGSSKAYFLGSHSGSKIARFVNIVVGIYFGASVAFHYSQTISSWAAGVISLIGSSLSVAMIDALFKITPEITDKLTKKYLGVDEPNYTIPVRYDTPIGYDDPRYDETLNYEQIDEYQNYESPRYDSGYDDPRYEHIEGINPVKFSDFIEIDKQKFVDMSNLDIQKFN